MVFLQGGGNSEKKLEKQSHYPIDPRVPLPEGAAKNDSRPAPAECHEPATRKKTLNNGIQNTSRLKTGDRHVCGNCLDLCRAAERDAPGPSRLQSPPFLLAAKRAKRGLESAWLERRFSVRTYTTV